MAEANPLDPDAGGKLLALDWHPPDRVVRQFGWICAALLPLAAWFWLGRPFAAPWTDVQKLWLARTTALGAAAAALGTVRPGWLRPAFVGLCLLFYPLGLLLSAVLLRAVYYLVFTPIALWFRIRGRDALGLKFDRAAETYWTPRPPMPEARRYFRLS